MKWWLFAVMAAALSGCGGSDAAATSPLGESVREDARASASPFFSISQLLPPLPIAQANGQDYRARCGDDGVPCLQAVENKLAEWEAFFGCDHRAVFPTVYKLLTREAKEAIMANPSAYDDPAGLGYEALEFYALYEQMITNHLAGRAVPPAWQTTLDAAQRGDWTGGHDMLLAINAHVQRDMPFAVAKTGLRLPDGSSRKPDHDEFNTVLNRAYPKIVEAIGRRYDPVMLTVANLGIPGNLAAMQLVVLWREGVWRNAERIVMAEGTPLAEATAQTIEQQAQLTALAMKNVEIPGHRILRDSYCQAATMQGQSAP